MKRILFYVLCFIAFLTFATGCNKKEIVGIEVTNHEQYVLKGTELKGLKVNTIFDDETKGDLLDVTSDMIFGYDKTKTGNQDITVKHQGKEFNYTVFVADKIITNATELRNALKNQKDGEVYAIKSGTYDIDRDQETIYQDQAGFYFLITANSLTIKGFNNVTIKSSVESPNGNWASQNLVTIIGDNTTIEGVTFQCKKEPNKVIEIIGKNTTIKDVKIEPIDTTKFAGSIYLSTTSGNTTLENVNLIYGRITTSGASSSSLTLKNVTIDYAGAMLDNDTNESTFWGFDNSRTKITVNATDSKIFVSKSFKDSEGYKDFTNQLPKGLSVEEKK